MSEFKGTTQEVIKDQEYIAVLSKEFAIAKVFDNKLLHQSVVEANQNLIVDAFKVRQQINCELSELLEQRNEMLSYLIQLQKDNLKDTNLYPSQILQLGVLIKKTNR